MAEVRCNRLSEGVRRASEREGQLEFGLAVAQRVRTEVDINGSNEMD